MSGWSRFQSQFRETAQERRGCDWANMPPGQVLTNAREVNCWRCISGEAPRPLGASGSAPSSSLTSAPLPPDSALSLLDRLRLKDGMAFSDPYLFKDAADFIESASTRLLGLLYDVERLEKEKGAILETLVDLYALVSELGPIPDEKYRAVTAAAEVIAAAGGKP
jgi:hypothetical protein